MRIPDRLLKTIDIYDFEKYGKILRSIRELIQELSIFDCERPKAFEDEIELLEKLKLRIIRGFLNKSLNLSEWFIDYCENFELETGLPLQKRK